MAGLSLRNEMASYKITSPDGQVYRVNAPDDASQDDSLIYIEKAAIIEPRIKVIKFTQQSLC